MLSVNAREVYEKVKEIDSKLRADSPIFNGAVCVIHEEGTVLFYQNAGLVKIDANWIAVFSEHNGFNLFHQEDLHDFMYFKREYDKMYFEVDEIIKDEDDS